MPACVSPLQEAIFTGRKMHSLVSEHTQSHIIKTFFTIFMVNPPRSLTAIIAGNDQKSVLSNLVLV